MIAPFQRLQRQPAIAWGMKMKSFCRMVSRRSVLSVVVVVAALWAGPQAQAEDATARLAETVRGLEERLDARIGVFIRDSGSDWQWGHREDERFLMASTFKSVLCGAVLEQAEQGALALDEPVEIRAADILSYAPVTETRQGGTMTIGELCLATADMSDNTAANLLLARLGGPQAVTAFLRGIGDAVTPAPRQTFIGSPCSSNADCTFSDEATCRAFAGADGYCVIPCQGYCPDRAGFATTFCVGDDRNDSGQCVPKAHTANGYCESYEGVTPQDVERFIGASSASAATAAVCF